MIDRFHVAKLYRKGLDTLRKQELQRLKRELSEEEYKQLQGVMWALRKKEAHLTDEDKDLLARLFVHAPLVKLPIRRTKSPKTEFPEGLRFGATVL